MLVPATRSIGIRCSSNHWMTPMCARPRGTAAAEGHADDLLAGRTRLSRRLDPSQTNHENRKHKERIDRRAYCELIC